MKSPWEMALTSVLPLVMKHMGLDEKLVMAEFMKIRATVGQIGAAGIAIFNGVCEANRRLARLEAAAGLSDIEPVTQPMKVLSHDESAQFDDGREPVRALDPPGAR